MHEGDLMCFCEEKNISVNNENVVIQRQFMAVSEWQNYGMH